LGFDTIGGEVLRNKICRNGGFAWPHAAQANAGRNHSHKSLGASFGVYAAPGVCVRGFNLLSVIVKTSEPALSAPRQERSRRSMRRKRLLRPQDRLSIDCTMSSAILPGLSASWNKRGLKIKIYWPIGLLILMGTAPRAKRKIVGRSTHTLSDNHALFLSYCNNFHSDCHLIVANAMHGYKRTDESGAAMRLLGRQRR
jgi:hypothetical protein